MHHEDQGGLRRAPFEQQAVGHPHAARQRQWLEIHPLDLQAGGPDGRNHGVNHGSPRRNQVYGVALRVAARVPGEVDIGRLHWHQAATFEGDGAAELAAGQPRQVKIAERGPGLGDRDASAHGGEATGIEGAAHGRRQQGCGDPIHHRPLGEQHFGMMGEAAAVGLEQPQLARPKIQTEPGRHWNASHVTLDAPLTSVTRAVRVRLVPVTLIVMFQVAPLPWH